VGGEDGKGVLKKKFFVHRPARLKKGTKGRVSKKTGREDVQICVYLGEEWFPKHRRIGNGTDSRKPNQWIRHVHWEQNLGGTPKYNKAWRGRPAKGKTSRPK